MRANDATMLIEADLACTSRSNNYTQMPSEKSFPLGGTTEEQKAFSRARQQPGGHESCLPPSTCKCK